MTNKLEESLENFRNIAEQSLIGILVIQDGVFKYFNDKFLEICGYSAEEVLSWVPNEFVKIIHPEDREFVIEQVRKKVAGDSDIFNQDQFRIIRKDEEIIIVEIFSKTINYNGRFADLIMTLDITDKIKAEQKLKKFMDSATDCFFLLDSKLNCINLNKKALTMLGLKKEEVIGKNILEIQPSLREKSRYNKYLEVVKTGKSFFIEDVNPDPKLGELHYNLNAFKVGDGLGVIATDITKQKKIEHDLRESEEKFFKAFNSNALAMSISTFEEGRMIEVNDAFLKLLGLTRKKLIGKTAKEANLWGKGERKRMLRTVKEEGSVINYETDYKSKDREVRYGLFSFVKIEFNKKPYLLTIINDITRRKLVEKKLIESKEKYRQAYNQAEFYKDIFIHDINNTLQSLYSSIQLIDMNLEKISKRNSIKELIDIIYKQVNRGIKLTSNVHKLSQLENHEISIEEVELFKFLNRSIEFIKNSFQDKKVQIKYDTFSDKISILGNDLLQDVFENIMINSVRYNDNDIVEIIIRISRVEEDGIIYCKLEFIDNGIGIEDERKEKVLTRVDPNSKTTYGMGLGLSLVKKIIDNYEGKVWIEDRVDGDYSKGTNVILLIQKGDS
ncbi:MAG: PAS domain S-box protein [Promethearchaeota archaeon]